MNGKEKLVLAATRSFGKSRRNDRLVVWLVLGIEGGVTRVSHLDLVATSATNQKAAAEGEDEQLSHGIPFRILVKDVGIIKKNTGGEHPFGIDSGRGSLFHAYLILR